jgi:hypothetical protein
MAQCGLRRHRRFWSAHAHRNQGRFSNSRNLLLSAIIFVVGISGIPIKVGQTQLKGMVLALSSALP